MSHPYPPPDPYGAWQDPPAAPPAGAPHQPYAGPYGPQGGAAPYGPQGGAPYGQPGPYGPQPGAAPYGWVQSWQQPPQAVSTNGMAIASLVLGILWMYWIGSVLAVVFGHVGLRQIRRDPYQGGRGMAVAGLVLGYIGVAMLALTVVFFVAAGLSGPTSPGVRSLGG